MKISFDITVVSGTSSGSTFHFKVGLGEDVVIGRKSDCDLVLEDRSVSRNHAKLEQREEGLYIVDLGSTSGTVHMGFRLSPDQQGRRLSPNDEFKIGETIFRISFKETKPAVEKSVEKGETKAKLFSGGRSIGFKVSTRGRLLIISLLSLLALLLVFFTPGDSDSLPKQLSHQKMELPQERVVGFYRGGKRKNQIDMRHLDKAQFVLPAADVLVEYDYCGESEVEVLVDESLIETIPPYTACWQRRALLVRDVHSGESRTLIFDNKAYPRAKSAGDKTGRRRRWAIRNIRVRPYAGLETLEFEKQLRALSSLIEQMDKRPDSLYGLLRGLHLAVLGALSEAALDGFGYGVDLEIEAPRGEVASQRVGEILAELGSLNENKNGTTPLSKLGDLAMQVDAELWRRVNSRLIRARVSSKSKEHITTYDELQAIRAMFPDGDDFRWVIASRLFDNKKFLPAKVKNKPGKYRKRRK